MLRRDVISLPAVAVGASSVWPRAARAQQREPMRRIGVLLGRTEADPTHASYLALCRRELQELGWREGANVRIDVRSAENDTNRARQSAGELLALAPDVVLTVTGFALAGMLPQTRTVPIVFTSVID